MNQNAMTVSALSMHFSDWSEYENHDINVAKSHLATDESTTITVTYNELLAPLVSGDQPIQSIIPKVASWNLNGKGTLVANSGASATYKAPASMPPSNPQEIVAKIIIGNGELLLFARVYVEDGYIDVNFNGQNYHYSNPSIVLGSTTEIHGGISTNGIRITLNGGGVGSFSFEDPQNDPVHATQMAFQPGGPDTYTSYYLNCAGEWHIPPGVITTTTYGNAGEIVEGSFVCTVATVTGATACTPKLVEITGKFRGKRS